MSNLIGKTLGPYRIIEQIGLGGMATVYKAYQPSMDRYVALKVLSTHLSQTPTFVKRFQQEAKVIAKLEHLHILPVYDHGEDDDYLYLVMRFIEAGTLKDRLMRAALSLEETQRVVNQVGSALAYAHQLGVIHRDLKPSNILVDRQGDCYLTDFGIAKMTEGALSLTGSSMIGTPQYMAPEQGESVKVDERADIYAMGVVIYEMVTGRLPFDAETPFAVVMKHLTEPLPLPRSLRPDLPEEVERVILKALAKHPADRYQTMRDLVTAFDQAVQAAPAGARAAAPAPLALATGEVSPAAGTFSTASLPTQPLQVTVPPLWILAVAGLGLVVLVVAGLILRQVPFQLTGNGLQMQVSLLTNTPTVTEAATEKSIPSPTAMAAPPTPTPPAMFTAIPTSNPQESVPTATVEVPSALATKPVALVGSKWEKLTDGVIFPRVQVNALVVDPRDPKVIYAGADGAGLYKSSDGGVSWQLANNGLDRGMILTLAFDPQQADTLYAGSSLGGVYKSTNGGQGWQPANTGLGDTKGWEWISIVAADPHNSQHLYYTNCGSGATLWETKNGGNSWEKRAATCPRCLVALNVDPQNSQTLYAAENGNDQCPAGIYKSTDGGFNWQQANAGLANPQPLTFWKIALSPQQSQTLYVADRSNNRVYRSSDGAASWEALSLPNSCDSLQVDPQDKQTVYCGVSQGVSKSIDGGASWQSHPLPADAESVRELVILPQDRQTIYAGGLGVYRSTDGGVNWASLNSGLGSTRLELTLDPRDKSTLYVETGQCQLYRSRNQGETWEKVTNRGCSLTIDPNNGALYRSDGDRAIRSTDGGRTWTEIMVPEKGLFKVAVHPRQSQTLYAIYSRQNQYFMYISINDGQTWQRVQAMGSIFIATMFFDHQQGQVAYTFGDLDSFRSADGGQTWQPCARTGSWHSISSSRLLVDPRDSNRLVVATRGDGLLLSQDGCQNWGQLGTGLGNRFVNAIAQQPTNPDLMYAATDGGVFVSADGGQQWSPLSEGLGPHAVVYSIAVDPNDPAQVYAATPDGIFRLVSAPPVSAAGSSAEQARAFAESILAAIKDRPPDYQDDFSNPGSGWEIGTESSSLSAFTTR